MIVASAGRRPAHLEPPVAWTRWSRAASLDASCGQMKRGYPSDPGADSRDHKN
jgi:hypothetical protein